MVVDRVVAKVAEKSKKAGVELVGLEGGAIQIPSPFEARSQGVVSEFDIGITNKDKVRSRIEAQAVEVTAAGIFPPKIRVQVQDFSVVLHSEDVPEDFPFGGFRSGSFMSAPMSLLSPESALRESYGRLEALFDENEVDADFNFSGYVSVPVGGDVTVDALLYTERLDNGKRALRFKVEDLEQIRDKAQLNVSDAMLEILATYPLRAPVIMYLSDDARKRAKEKKVANSQFPEDAYRHVNWSYELTKVFGGGFAKLVTDAHETLDGNTKQERLMDYHNNAVAREFALSGVARNQLEKLILNDPRVIRSPDEVDGYVGLKR
ncbi:DUF6973 domain-containing protein [Rubritalea tangerina]|uniref:DUF6973 domain-containing protein n=2 Tax=Rubritalea tangerina TaxID=430798 RepID=A0ABW4Z8N2_9BACT